MVAGTRLAPLREVNVTPMFWKSNRLFWAIAVPATRVTALRMTILCIGRFMVGKERGISEAMFAEGGRDGTSASTMGRKSLACGCDWGSAPRTEGRPGRRSRFRASVFSHGGAPLMQAIARSRASIGREQEHAALAARGDHHPLADTELHLPRLQIGDH